MGKVLAEITKYIKKSWQGEKDKIAANFEIGRILAETTYRYGDRFVERVAVQLTRSLGRVVYPVRLYEMRRVYKQFNSVEEIYKVFDDCGIEPSWNYIVEMVCRRPLRSARREEEEFWQKKLSRWEGVLSELETAPPPPEWLKDEVDGLFCKTLEVVSARKPSAAVPLPACTTRPRKSVKEVLKEIITYDEVTGQGLLIEQRHPHHIVSVGAGGRDMVDNIIIVSPSTHTQVHAGMISKEKLLKVVKERNLYILERLLVSLDVTTIYNAIKRGG